jgi:hypothetical protein
MLIFTLIVAAELILLFRLLIPDFLAWAEARHDAVYNKPHGDWPAVPVIESPFHDGGV